MKTSRQQQRGMGRCLLVLGGLLGLVLLGCAGTFWMWVRASAQRVEDQLAELRARGEPTTPEELDAYYSYPPEHQDVTPLLLAAIEELDTPEFEAAARDVPIVGAAGGDIPPPGQPWEEREAARELLDQFAAPLRQLHEAAENGGAARYPLEFEDGLDMSLDHAQQLRSAARLLALQAHVRAAEGDSRSAARSIRALLSLARSVETEPQLLSQLVGYLCQGVAHRLISDLLPHVRFADEELAMLGRELRRSEIAEGARRGLIGERVQVIQAMREPEVFREIGGSPVLISLGTDEDMAFYLETMKQFVEASEKPWPDALELAALIEQEASATIADSAGNQLRYTASRLMLSFVKPHLGDAARADAARRVADAALAVERYRREHDRPPPKLEMLVPEYLPAVPRDPFSGQPLRYVLEEDEIAVYSIGRNEVDDGGHGDADWDIVTRLPRR